MKSVFLSALGLAVALAFTPALGVAAADAAPMQKHHVVHHPKHKVVHHTKHKVVHHPKHKVVHHKKGVHGVPNKKP